MDLLDGGHDVSGVSGSHGLAHDGVLRTDGHLTRPHSPATTTHTQKDIQPHSLTQSSQALASGYSQMFRRLLVARTWWVGARSYTHPRSTC